MAKRRIRKRAFIRRRRPQKQKEAAVKEPVVEEQAKNTQDEGDWGFVSGYRAGDFVQSEVAGDFVSDNEIEVSDETFEEFEKVFGDNEQLMEQGKNAADGLGRAIGMIDTL